MATKAWKDENGVANFIYDNIEDMFTIYNFKSGDPLYEKGIAGLMTINLPHFDAQGNPELQLKTVEVKRLNFE